MKYVITKVYVVEADDAARALQILLFAAAEGKAELYRAEPERVRLQQSPKPKGWTTVLLEQLFGRRKDDPRSVVL